MKTNKWTLGLAAAGLISLTPGLQAQDVKPPPQVPVMTALSATTISGYVDTSAVWNPGTGNAHPAPFAFNSGKQDGFNLDQALIQISKPLEEGKWSAGYTFSLSYGPDATAIDGGAYPIRQAFVSLQAPIGNGLQFEIGRFDNILGYEFSDSYKDPNFTRSYAYSIEPTEHTGLLASYTFAPWIQAQVGVVDTVTTASAAEGGINARNLNGAGFSTTESTKGVISLITLTAPDSWGFLKGSTLSGGADYGPGFGGQLATPSTHDVNKVEVYVGTQINTPISALTFGACYDSISGMEGGPPGAVGSGSGFSEGYAMAVDGYVNYKLTDKLSINGRGEYTHGTALFGGLGAPLGLPAFPSAISSDPKILAFTGTLQYDLWENVISRLEVRWDHAADGTDHFGGIVGAPATKKNDVMVAANIVYKF